MLNDRIALITGAGRGIGASIATRFAEENAIVIIADVVIDAAEEIADGIRSGGGRAEAVMVDVTDKEQVVEVVTGIAKKHNRLDILINNAGITRDMLGMKMKEDEWDLVI
ncbi:MAG: SDR family NAD(P)-dependent oxidoreductase, partial [Calditrichaeota bacterium]|nr:SDR family NAD(P)-dependent oxidoreductase [Calditrichota bacterium]